MLISVLIVLIVLFLTHALSIVHCPLSVLKRKRIKKKKERGEI